MGERRIGVALSDPQGLLATPLTTLNRDGTPADYHRILDLARRHEVGQLVVGLPVSMNGRMGPQARRLLAFVKGLEEVSPLPVALWDERLTSTEAARRLGEAGVRNPRDKGRIDAAAAALILQAYLDAHRTD